MSGNKKIPRWLTAIEGALEKDSNMTVYQLATIRTTTSETASIPAVRSHVHRAFLSLKPTRPLLITTTDVRTPKAHQLAQNANIAIAWYLPATQEQMRITGRAFVFPSQDADAKLAAVKPEQFPGAELADGKQGFDWEVKRQELFESMSGHMKASWARPVPGTPLSGGYEAAGAWPEKLPTMEDAKDEREKEHIREALRNFALVVIDPLEVDYVELGTVPNQRTKFTKGNTQDDGWNEEIVVP